MASSSDPNKQPMRKRPVPTPRTSIQPSTAGNQQWVESVGRPLPDAPKESQDSTQSSEDVGAVGPSIKSTENAAYMDMSGAKLNVDRQGFIKLNEEDDEDDDEIGENIYEDVDYVHFSYAASVISGKKRYASKYKDLPFANVIHEVLEVSKAGMIRYLDSEKWAHTKELMEQKYDVMYDVAVINKQQHTETDVKRVLSSIHRGPLSQIKVDVLVNFAPAFGDFTIYGGPSAQDLVKHGGTEIESEYYRLKAESGGQDIVIPTGGGKLECKTIYHVVCPMWDGPDGEAKEHLKMLVECCLSKAHADGAESLAFPSSGLGIDSFPSDLVANIISEEIFTYNEMDHDSSLKNVFIAVDKPDEETMKIFTRVLSGDDLPSKSEQAEPVKSKGVNETVQLVRLPCTIDLNGIEMEIVEGSILSETSDVIVNTTSKDLNLKNGKVSRSLLRIATNAIQKECKKNYKSGIQLGDIAVTSGGKMPCKHIYHTACSPWNPNKTEQELCGVISKCLHQAGEDGMKSISFPAIGTGVLQYPHEFVARCMMEEVKRYSQDCKCSLPEKVRVIIYDGPTIQYFVRYLQNNYEALWPSPKNRNDKHIPGSDQVYNQHKTCLHIFGLHNSSIESAKQEFLNYYGMENHRVRLTDIDIMAKLNSCSDNQKDELCLFGRDHCVDVDIHTREGQEQIVIDGCEVDVIKAEYAIRNFLQNINFRNTNVKNYLEQHWSPKDKSQLYQLEPLSPSDESYRVVKRNLEVTNGPRNIVKIERVRNPTLLTLYLTKQTEINMTNGGDPRDNEKILYHGTNVESLESINSKGFDRSYSGQKASTYGQGVYFARDSSYSAKKNYSPPDSSGQRYMYQCRVMTGRCVLGKEAMKRPPALDGEATNGTYDSTVGSNIRDPKIYVIYHDAQAYPEYLITFK